MPDDMFGEPKRGLLARLGRVFAPRRTVTLDASVRRREQLNLTVPSAKAEAVRVAVERWLRDHGVGADVTSDDAGDGKSRIRAKLGESDAAKIDFSSEDTQSTLQDVLADALR